MRNIQSIILLGTENILALSVIRSLGRELPEAQIYTYSPFSKSKSISERSRFVRANHYFESWSDPLFHFKLRNVIHDVNADVILPVSDAAVRKLASVKNNLQNTVHMPPLPDEAVYDRLEDKYELTLLLKKIGLPVPRTWYLKRNIAPVINHEQFPLLLKPKSGSSGLGIQTIHNEKELLDTLKSTKVDDFILQEMIPGNEYGCSILALNGEIKAYTIQHVLGNKGFGVATAIRFVKDDKILEQTKRIIKNTQYSGLAHLDFRVDSRDHEAKLLDFNARFWHSLRGSKAAGVDFAYLYCIAAFGVYLEKIEYEPITYFLGSNTVRYYFNKMFNLRAPFEATKQVYTDLWDRLGDPLPEFARYIH